MSKEKSSAVEMMVAGILLDPATQAPVVILQTEDGEQQLPIWIGMAEATSIAASLKSLSLSRPLTHDLFISLLDELSVSVEQVMITSIKDSTYLAELVLATGEKAIILDCRPSDAIAVALRSSAPIFVNDKVLQEAQKDLAIQKLKEAPLDVEDDKDEIKDLQYIDKSKWSSILEDLDKDDFKYKA